MMQLKKNIAFLEEQHAELKGIASADPKVSELNALALASGHSLENLVFHNLKADALPWNEISFVMLDVDGVMTEGGMYYHDTGTEFKRFDTKDGMAIKHGMKNGIDFGIISSGINEAVVQKRAQVLGIKHVYVGTEAKMVIAEQWIKDLNLNWDSIGYIGDDINDLPMFDKVRLKACPADAVGTIKQKSDLVLKANGGHGCIREFMGYFPALKSILS